LLGGIKCELSIFTQSDRNCIVLLPCTAWNPRWCRGYCSEQSVALSCKNLNFMRNLEHTCVMSMGDSVAKGRFLAVFKMKKNDIH